MITTTLFDRADLSFDDAGERRDDGYFYKDELALYLEYGLSDRFTLVSRAAWQTVERRRGPDFDSAQGFAATEIGLRGALYSSARQVVSLQAMAVLPGEGENISNQPLGDGGNAWEVRALWGANVADDGFADAQLAYRQRDGVYSDEARLDLTLGWQPARRWHVLAQSFSVWSLDAARPGAPEFEQHKLQVSVGREFGAVECHLGATMTPSGRNTIEERALFVSVWRRF
ncbi:hypothetical protein [Maricaulis salignorans]|uniref:Uncharacterized protein n=1 Tax=Maricaulis salignorans TaxID=144026 RepID=A0A1G9U9S4_9PROT|nr:hypothetical protein [Maricaulis salignorans]SDM56295.1 hypothetical protein SAMN04488568_11440 [Maricaulis salignorans]